MRGRGGGIAGNPVLIGAATVLVILVAVFLSYNANQGLPFVPDLPAQGRGAERRQRSCVGNDVRIGGSRVGAVDAITAKRSTNGTSDRRARRSSSSKDVGPLPKDSTLLIRPRSALGLKYVELTRGHVERRASRTATRSRSPRRARRRSSSTSS